MSIVDGSGASDQASLKERNKTITNERKKNYTSRKKIVLAKIKVFLNCERATENETLMRGGVWIFSSIPCFQKANLGFR